jgi:hypothetical protein
VNATVAVRAVRAGAGALEALATPGPGRVLAWFRAACYAELPNGLLALAGPGVWEGPLHLLLDRPVPRSAAGSAVEVRDGLIRGPGWTVHAAGAGGWSGAVPPPAAVRRAAEQIRRALVGIAARSRVEPEVAARAEELVATGDLEALAALLGGRGPGLTPAGDDALAGLLLVVRAAAGEEVEPRLAGIAADARTSPIARAFLRWAARGQSLRPAHELLTAATRGDARGAARWARLLAAVGGSSGADLALGMRWASAALA